MFTDKKTRSIKAMCTVDADYVQRVILNKLFDDADKSIDDFLSRALAVSLALEFQIGCAVVFDDFLKLFTGLFRKPKKHTLS